MNQLPRLAPPATEIALFVKKGSARPPGHCASDAISLKFGWHLRRGGALANLPSQENISRPNSHQHIYDEWYSNIRIGPVVKKDVMKASTMLEHDSQYATILAFDVKVERDAQELADTLGVKIFQADIIYHLFDKFMAYREELKQRKREEFKSVAVFPCKMRVLPQFVFNSRDPIVVGVMIEAGIIREGTPICVPSKESQLVLHVWHKEMHLLDWPASCITSTPRCHLDYGVFKEKQARLQDSSP
ncbi:hypothetical protein PR048_001515 [Dryococelus australis]|uniref:Translation initiation factor IF- 2 domain-containing protein n=1 Tax=Dryococelus australis TaxID=614101 RepID=A0ABQ9IHN5_9NEOP|nr:hypothetical protein PR048_001515 [Dryococelus australis]